MTSDVDLVGPPMSYVVETDVDGHIGLYNPVTVRVHVLNRTASDTWLLSDGEHTAREIVHLLAQAYQVDTEDIRATVLAAIETFRDQGLLLYPAGPT